MVPQRSSAKAEVVKFVDRIFLDCRTRTAEILRTLIVHVAEDSPDVLEGVHLLIPCHYNSFRTARDISDTCFLEPNEYRYNSVRTLGHKIIQRPAADETAGKGIIYTDGFEDVSVYTGNTIGVEQHAESTLARIEFPGCPVQRGEYREIRVLLSQDLSSSMVTAGRQGWLHLSLSYLTHEGMENAIDVLNANQREMAVRPLCDVDLRGGFDVFLYFPEHCDIREWSVPDFRIDLFGPDGKRGESIWRKGVWRMRWELERMGWSLDDIRSKKVRSGETIFAITGLLRPAFGVASGSARTGRLIGWIAILAFGVSLLTLAVVLVLIFSRL